MDKHVAEMGSSPPRQRDGMGEGNAVGGSGLDANPRHAGAGEEDVSSNVEGEEMKF